GRVRKACRLLEIRLVQLVREDRRAFRDRGAQTARMIDMRVRVDDVGNRLVGNQPLRFGDDRLAARLALSALDDRDVILEVDRDSGIAAENQVHTVAQLLGRRLRGRWRATTAAGGAAPLRRLNVDGRVCLYVG